MSLSKNQVKLITSLQQKKYRYYHKLFVVEGVKVVDEFLTSAFELDSLFCVDDTSYKHLEKVTVISENELKKISNLSNPNNVLAVFKAPSTQSLKNKGLIVALDDINDPGNLGTIIRLCDWFGVSQLICSSNTVDCFNSKVVQASMGSLTRVSIVYTDLFTYLNNATLPIYITSMKGVSVYKSKLSKDAILVMGNEANGVSEELFSLSQHHLTIPKVGENNKVESLNVATATAILLNEFRRN